MNNRLRMMRVLAYALGVAAGISMFLIFYFPYHYVRTRPQTPVVNEGWVVPLHDHGTVVYITNGESTLIFVCLLGGAVFGIFSALLFITIRRFE